jgi:predicted HTH transcriptional regulator
VQGKESSAMKQKHPITELISEGEGLHLDFKFEISDARKIARSLVAFANTAGGRLLVGVKDNGRIAGVRSEEEYYMVDAAARMHCRPEVVFEVREWTIDSKRVLDVIIPESSLKPHKAPDNDGKYKAFVRSADQNVLADVVQMQVWNLRRDPSGITIVYKEAEASLMDILRDRTSTTHKAFSVLAGINQRMAAEVLAKFIVLGIISYDTFEEGSIYYLSQPENKQ